MPISKELREDITKWGIAHLVAISGFHLGILSAILFFLLKPIYTFFQDRYFPYRNRTDDLAFIVFLLLGSYAYFIDMTPSVVRALCYEFDWIFSFFKKRKNHFIWNSIFYCERGSRFVSKVTIFYSILVLCEWCIFFIFVLISFFKS